MVYTEGFKEEGRKAQVLDGYVALLSAHNHSSHHTHNNGHHAVCSCGNIYAVNHLSLFLGMSDNASAKTAYRSLHCKCEVEIMKNLKNIHFLTLYYEKASSSALFPATEL